MSNKNVLVTGGAGLIGSHLCESLLDKNYHITCIDSLITGQIDNINHLLYNSLFKFIKADVSKPQEYNSKLGKEFKYIFHLASPASPIGYQKYPIKTYEVNSFGTHYLLKLVKKHQARFLFASTSEVYGDPLEHPQKESYWGNVNPVGTRSCYDESKRFGEMACMTFHRLYNLDVRIVRIFNTYGPRNDPNDGRVVPNFIVQSLTNQPLTVYGKGHQTRSFCFVTDMVKGIEKAMFTDKQSGLIINLGNPDEFRIIDFARLVKKTTNSQSKIIYKSLPQDDPQRRQPDIKKAKKVLNWHPKVSIEKGLEPTIVYFKKIINGK